MYSTIIKLRRALSGDRFIIKRFSGSGQPLTTPPIPGFTVPSNVVTMITSLTWKLADGRPPPASGQELAQVIDSVVIGVRLDGSCDVVAKGAIPDVTARTPSSSWLSSLP